MHEAILPIITVFIGFATFCVSAALMDTAHLVSLVEHLEDNIDDLEDNLEPLLSTALTATTKKLPLLDKAKLYVLIVYSIESLLFCKPRIRLTTEVLIVDSILATKWSESERSSCLQRIGESKAILREAQGCRRRSYEAKRKS